MQQAGTHNIHLSLNQRLIEIHTIIIQINVVLPHYFISVSDLKLVES